MLLHADLQFGLIPEFVGRFPCVVHLESLTEDDLVRVLTEPKNSLVSQYRALFRMESVSFIDLFKSIVKANDTQSLHFHFFLFKKFYVIIYMLKPS